MLFSFAMFFRNIFSILIAFIAPDGMNGIGRFAGTAIVVKPNVLKLKLTEK